VPPRYAYWTILIDDKPTAFRAREREELQPTFVQLQRKNANVIMQWFARGKLWPSREAERADFQMQKHAASAPRERPADRPAGAERRGSDWRPGGKHKDPRDRFKKRNRPERAWSEKDPATQRDRDKPGYTARPRGDAPWTKRPPTAGGWTNKPKAAQGFDSAKPREQRPWSDKSGPPSDRPWQKKPTGPRAQRKPWVGKPQTPGGFNPAKPRGDRPWSRKPDAPRSFTSTNPRDGQTSRDKPAGGPPGRDRPWSNKAAAGRPWHDKPRGDRPPGGRPPSASGPRPWSGKPRDSNAKSFAPNRPRPGGTRDEDRPRKRRDDED